MVLLPARIRWYRSRWASEIRQFKGWFQHVKTPEMVGFWPSSWQLVQNFIKPSAVWGLASELLSSLRNALILLDKNNRLWPATTDKFVIKFIFVTSGTSFSSNWGLANINNRKRVVCGAPQPISELSANPSELARFAYQTYHLVINIAMENPL